MADNPIIASPEPSGKPTGPPACAWLLRQVKQRLSAVPFEAPTTSQIDGLLADINWHLTTHHPTQSSGTSFGDGGRLPSSSAAQPNPPEQNTSSSWRSRF